MASGVQIPWCKPHFFGKEATEVNAALASGWISGGPYVTMLETRMAKALGIEHAIAVSNGTTALELALRGAQIGPGDEVIVPAFTFVAAASMVHAVGATPVFADIDPDTWLLDPEEICRLATPATRAVIPVHLYGNMADMDTIMAAAQAHDLLVIEDAAEAIFSQHSGRYAGTIGDIGTFSFHATKTITTGEGGMLTVRSAELANRMRRLRDHGMTPGKRYHHDLAGHNFRLSNLQAAMGCAQLDYLAEIIDARRVIHARYRAFFEGSAVLGKTRLQTFHPTVAPVLWAIACALPDQGSLDLTRGCRDGVIARLADDGIETRPGFYAMSLLPPYDCPELPIASAVSAAAISLPTFVGLTQADITHVCDRFAFHLERELAT
jgi:perosamine synthetase